MSENDEMNRLILSFVRPETIAEKPAAGHVETENEAMNKLLRNLI